LAGAIPGQDVPKDERAGEEKRDRDSKDKTAKPIGDHHEEDDV
jgi:hypothetical protein